MKRFILINGNKNLGLYFGSDDSNHFDTYYINVTNEIFTEMYVKADWLSDNNFNKKSSKISLFYLDIKYLKEFKQIINIIG